MMMTVVVPRRANQCNHVKVSSVKPIASHKGQVCWFLNQICVVTMPEVCRWTVWTLSPCFLSYTQVHLFCQQKSAAWSTMSPFYNSGDVVLPCEIIVVEISPPLWQKGMPRPLFSYIAHHVSCKKKMKCQEWINGLLVCTDALKNWTSSWSIIAVLSKKVSLIG